MRPTGLRRWRRRRRRLLPRDGGADRRVSQGAGVGGVLALIRQIFSVVAKRNAPHPPDRTHEHKIDTRKSAEARNETERRSANHKVHQREKYSMAPKKPAPALKAAVAKPSAGGQVHRVGTRCGVGSVPPTSQTPATTRALPSTGCSHACPSRRCQGAPRARWCSTHSRQAHRPRATVRQHASRRLLSLRFSTTPRGGAVAVARRDWLNPRLMTTMCA